MTVRELEAAETLEVDTHAGEVALLWPRLERGAADLNESLRSELRAREEIEASPAVLDAESGQPAGVFAVRAGRRRYRDDTQRPDLPCRVQPKRTGPVDLRFAVDFRGERVRDPPADGARGQ